MKENRTITIKSTGILSSGEEVGAFRQRISFIASLSNSTRQYGWNGLPTFLEDAKAVASLENSVIVGNVIIKPSSRGWVFVSFTFKNGEQIQRTIRVRVLTVDGKETDKKNPLGWFLSSIADRSEIVLELDTTDHR